VPEKVDGAKTDSSDAEDEEELEVLPS